MIIWNIHPVVFHVGPITIRWYGLFFFLGAFFLARSLFHDKKVQEIYPLEQHRDWLISSMIFGCFLGAKAGYLLFYVPRNTLILETAFSLQGFSFHGAVLGLAMTLYLWSKQITTFLSLTDRVVYFSPLALFLGRLGNLFNSELIGRASDVPWAFIFIYAEAHPIARHPSQIYEALGEGLVLGLMLKIFYQRYKNQPAGSLTAVFFIAYGAIRLFLEQFRCPDAQLGFVVQSWTMGQLLCGVMMILGSALWLGLQHLHRHK